MEGREHRTTNFLIVDQSTAYTSRDMKEKLEVEGIKLMEVQIETPGKIGGVERYHAPLRAPYTRLRADLDTATSASKGFHLAVFAVYNTVGPDGLCSALLLFRSMHSPAGTTASLTQLERANAN